MRTESEIIHRLKIRHKSDFLGFEVNEYFRSLSAIALESLRGSILKKDADLSEHVPDLVSDEAIKKCCVDYMSFAWEKANNYRGISASRSLSHYKAWLWLLGHDEFEDIEDYGYYGKDNLVRICVFLGIDATQYDDGVRSNYEP